MGASHYCAQAFSSCHRPLSSCDAQASHCSGFSCCDAQALGVPASAVVAHRLSCSVACGNLPGPGTEPVSPALAGILFTTGPPRKSDFFLNYYLSQSELGCLFLAAQGIPYRSDGSVPKIPSPLVQLPWEGGTSETRSHALDGEREWKTIKSESTWDGERRIDDPPVRCLLMLAQRAQVSSTRRYTWGREPLP